MFESNTRGESLQYTLTKELIMLSPLQIQQLNQAEMLVNQVLATMPVTDSKRELSKVKKSIGFVIEKELEE
jgi:hypothetical protein